MNILAKFHTFSRSWKHHVGTPEWSAWFERWSISNETIINRCLKSYLPDICIFNQIKLKAGPWML